MKRGELLLLNANFEIMNQCFKDLDEFGKEDKERYEIIKANHSKFYTRIKKLLEKELKKGG